MPTVRATDRRGREHELTVPEGTVLMEEMRSLEDGVFALCGGACACATCHVYVDAEWVSKLSAPLPQESDMLSELPMRRSNSRLACQVVLGEELTGLKVTIAPDGE
jgi:ferredoxin, 2Fe-2S